jgi:putative polymerase
VADGYPAVWVLGILLAASCTLPVLAFINARGVGVSSATVALSEALIFALCLGVQLKRLPVWTIALGLCALSSILMTWLFRQGPDLKSARDVLIPILLVSLGRYVADIRFAERWVRWFTALVVVVGLLEVLFTDAYGTMFNTFSFYAKLGSIQESAAMFSGQTLTLNGYRPEGIGRTLLPGVLGAHRASSIFLEPVSLGNFAVILLAWALSHSRKAFDKSAALLCAAAVLLIVLSDSRFGLLMAALLLTFRVFPLPLFRWLSPLVPFALMAVILSVAVFLPGDGDNVLGRISASGNALLRFDSARLMGVDSPMPGYGDMGYAYVLSRFGVLQVLAMVLVLFLVPAPTVRSERFRGLIVLYFFASLAISGTSVFALKTAGLMWFLFGTLSAASAILTPAAPPLQRAAPPDPEPEFPDATAAPVRRRV